MHIQTKQTILNDYKKKSLMERKEINIRKKKKELNECLLVFYLHLKSPVHYTLQYKINIKESPNIINTT